MQLFRRKFLELVAGAAALPNVVAHMVGEQLSERLGQQFVVESRPGAGSTIAAQYVVTAAADGYTLLLATGANAINASLYAHLNFNFVRDLTPVAVIVNVPFVLVISPSVPVKTFPELIAYGKANSGKINVASPGIGTTLHLAIELLKIKTHVDVVHVPYRASYVADLLGGQVQAAVSTITQVIQFIRDGRLRARAVTSTTRSDALPDVPTIGEFVRGYDASSWFGVCAPKETAVAIVEKLNKEINSVVAIPDVKKRLTELGMRPISMAPAKFQKLIADETEKWAELIRAAGIKADAIRFDGHLPSRYRCTTRVRLRIMNRLAGFPVIAKSMNTARGWGERAEKITDSLWMSSGSVRSCYGASPRDFRQSSPILSRTAPLPAYRRAL